VFSKRRQHIRTGKLDLQFDRPPSPRKSLKSLSPPQGGASLLDPECPPPPRPLYALLSTWDIGVGLAPTLLFLARLARFSRLSEGVQFLAELVALPFGLFAPPTLSIPSSIIVEADRPEGVVVEYDASANDDSNGPLIFTCSPASGSTFPIGTTKVECVATDAAGNTASASFDVIVQGATEQVTDLNHDIANLNLPAGTNTSLSATLQQAQSSIDADNISAALGQLNAFINQVKALEQRRKLSSQEAADLISSAEQIKVVLGG
jgi:hypothetical protein